LSSGKAKPRFDAVADHASFSLPPHALYGRERADRDNPAREASAAGDVIGDAFGGEPALSPDDRRLNEALERRMTGEGRPAPTASRPAVWGERGWP
jgi:hypothetical protein